MTNAQAHTVVTPAKAEIADSAALEADLDALSRAPSLKEMARILVRILDRWGATASVWSRSPNTSEWNCLNGESPASGPDGAVPDHGRTGSLLDEKRSALEIIHPLSDGTLLRLVSRAGAMRGTFSAADIILMKSLLQNLSGAYRLIQEKRNQKDLLFALNQRVLQLNSLIDTGIEVSKLKHSGSLHELALERAASLTNASRGILTVSTAGQEVTCYHFPGGSTSDEPISENHRIQSSFEFLRSSYDFELIDKESRSGIIPFDETDRMLLDALARQVQASLENRYLLQQALDKQKIEQDIAVAASIQQRILPEELPRIQGYDIFGINIPTKSVGGDYYDCIRLPDGRIVLVIADVSGKGVPAALLVSSFHAFLGAYLEGTVALVDLAQRLNGAIYRASTDDRFITAFLGLLDPDTGKLQSISAGHNPVYIARKNGCMEELSAGGVALGMLDMQFPYMSDEVRIEKGDRLLLYTDGITEATNEGSALYDNCHPLKEFVAENGNMSAKEFVNSLISNIKQFCGSAPQGDDITALYIIRS